ncbi:hypothetical protein IBL26_15220 [Roseomonas aerophila]|uniref:Lipoprotein n=1 Tax=Teichococcus aerophilus TaxID=1224513 RepID=A0ABR7RP89_9PROT|nr:hypothetical protein [Pseudoroseomonas aerophila]MBC9208193.1 hypothetical protein [Pseudoroseomonas aerophila]
MRAWILGTAALALLTGCASTPVPLAEARPIPPTEQRLFADPLPMTAPVIVRRDLGAGGRACATTIFVDGEAAAWINAGEVATLHVPAGEVIVGAEASGICAGALIEQAVTLTQGRPVYFRIARDEGNSLRLYRTTAR